MKEGKKSEMASRLVQDHKGLNEDIGALKIFMMKEVEPRDFGDWRLEFVWQLRDFKNRLLKHFDLEEEGGFMADVLEAAPHSENQINALKAEHDQIVVNLDDVMDQLKAMEARDVTRLNNIRMAVNDIFSVLREHENQEHTLMQRAYFREYGGPA
ncbi:hypothetical protein GWO43_11455 [candidate division KSB1 bacterium]|nr:hypothetical protein [candidate division KSB1 bacterium]NIR70619.1 hypothetical protein [candidate division KSB1 bacterium]NIS24564.1 hypothetical protein [candidate division KSB1 bacterium]NIT71482.1 hypothetical protein [candidate division KSB1 bacterium]NIU25173.1 hypothetical protein [candidate division KSB1 bacterium]